MRLLLILLLAISLLVPVLGQETAEDWLKKGDELCDQGKYSEAIQAYDKALEIDPRLSEAETNKVFALRNQRKARPETGTYVEDTARNGHGELTIINSNRTHDLLAVLARLDNAPLISVFIRSGESFAIPEIDDGEYNVTFSLGKVLDRGSKRFMEEGGYYRLDQPITFETVSESTRDKKMSGWDSWTFWYTSCTIALGESGPTSIGKETKVEEREVQYRKDHPLPPDTTGPTFLGTSERMPRDDGPIDGAESLAGPMPGPMY